jgi:hypothetical protein
LIWLFDNLIIWGTGACPCRIFKTIFLCKKSKIAIKDKTMKKIFLTLIFSAFLFGALFSQEKQLSWRLSNPEIIPGSPELFQFDIEVKCSETGTYLRDAQLYFDYNTDVFGESIKGNSKVSLQKIGVMAGEIAPNTYKYNWVNEDIAQGYGADNAENRYAVFSALFVESPPSATFHTLMPDEWIGFARVQIEITASGFAGIQFSESLMNGGQYYIGLVGEPIAYAHEAIYVNNLLDFEIIICDPPTDLYADDITGNSATLGWTAGYNESLWNIVWDEAGFDPQSEGTLIENWNESTYQLTGLVIDTDYEFYVQAVCGTDYSDWSGPYLFTTLGINTILHIEDVLVQTIEGDCFEATQTIYVAGNGTYFIVENNASAELVAGHNIVFLPGTLVENGGMLHAWITEDETYCNNTSSLLASNDEEDTFVSPYKLDTNDLFFKVFPNPTSGTFTLELLQTDDAPIISVSIFSMIGERLLQTELPSQNLYEFNLSNHPNGIYIIRVIAGDEMGVEKLIKH